MSRHSGQPFNEDHPDYERLVLQAQTVEPDQAHEHGFVVSMVLPPGMLLWMIHDEGRQLRWQRWAVTATALCVLLWIVLAAISAVPPWVGLTMGLVHGISLGFGGSTWLTRRRRWLAIAPVHAGLHDVMDRIEAGETEQGDDGAL